MSSSTALEVETMLKNQINFIDEIYKVQKAMYSSVIARDWKETEKQLKQLDFISKQFTSLDEKVYILLNADNKRREDFNFFDSTKKFQPDEKKRIDSLYEKLKEKVFYSKIENDVFLNYVNHAQELVQGVVDIITDERNGKCYTHTGKRVNVDMTSLVLNETL